MITLRSPVDLATTLKQLGVTPATLGNRQEAVAAIRAAGGDDRLARALNALGDKELDAVRTLLGNTQDSTRVVGERAGGTVRPDVLAHKLQRSLAPEVTKVLALYRPKTKEVDRPYERFLLHAGRLQDAFEKDGTSMLADPKVAEGVRKHLFMLESLVRLYEDRGPQKKMDKALEQIKELEDAIGAFGYACDMHKAAQAVAGVPSDAVAHLEHGVETARAELKALFHDGWRPDVDGRSKRLNDIVDTFAKIDFGTVKEDRAFVRAEMAKMCRDVGELNLDMQQLEDGVHELRRQLRWIPITLLALEGLVTLDDGPGPLPALEALRQDPVAQSPFARLTTSDADKKHITIPWTCFLALSKAVGDIGKIKDRGQQIEGIAHAIAHTGVTSAQAQEKAEALLGMPNGMTRVLADAATAADTLMTSGALGALADAFAQKDSG